MRKNIVLCGVGGQGTVLASRLISAAAMAKGIPVMPDVLCNCDSAIVCSFERTQGLTDSYWDAETVRANLEKRITTAYRRTYDTAKELNVSFRDAAWIYALKKIEKAMITRGWAWE